LAITYGYVSFFFHTSWISGGKLELRKGDIDDAYKDESCKHFKPNFKIECFFEDLDKQDPTEIDLETLNKFKEGTSSVPAKLKDDADNKVSPKAAIEAPIPSITTETVEDLQDKGKGKGKGKGKLADDSPKNAVNMDLSPTQSHKSVFTDEFEKIHTLKLSAYDNIKMSREKFAEMKKSISMAKRYVDLIPYMALLRRDDLRDGQTSDTTDVSGTVKFKTLKENIENKVLGFEQSLKKIEEDIRLAETFNEVVELSRGLSKFTKKSHKETVTVNGDKINIKDDTQHLARDISAKLGTLRSQLQNSQSLDEAVAIAQLVRDAKIILDS